MAYFGSDPFAGYSSAGSFMRTGDSNSAFLSGSSSGATSMSSSQYLGYAGVASSVLGTVSSLIGQARENKAKKAYQEYMNKMTNLGNATNQNAITQNEIIFNFASAEKAKQIQVGGMSSVAASAASAAAAGVKGNSVTVALNNIVGNAANAEFLRQRDFKYSMLGFDQQRKNSAMGGQLNQNNSYTGSSTVSSALGFASSALLYGAKYFNED